MAVDDKYTVALLHFDSDFTDECGGTWTPTGACVVDKSDLKLGTGALYTPNGAYLKCNNPKFAFGTGDFTIDFWMKYSSGHSGVSSCGSAGLGIQADVVWLGTGGTAVVVISSSGYFVPNAWAHYALVRSAGTCYYFVNGVLKATQSEGNFDIGTPVMSINSRYTDSYTGDAAYYDEFRISNVARWTSDFTPPTEPYSPGTSIFAPTNLTATAGDSQVSLSWTAVTGATGYNVKRATTAGGLYTTIVSNVSTNSYLDTTVTNGTTYYYVVTAVNADGESANSNEASATPVASSKALLRVTMSDSSEREYQLPSTDIDNFVKWYDRTVNTGNTCYTFNDSVDGSKEYLAFEKIISFKVIPLAK